MTAINQDPRLILELVRDATEGLLPADELRRLKTIEAAERKSFTKRPDTWRAR